MPRLVQGEHYHTGRDTGAQFCLTMPKVERPLKSLAQIKSSFSTSTVNGLPWTSFLLSREEEPRRIQFSSEQSFRIADVSKIFRFATLFSDTDVSRIVRVFRGFSIAELSTLSYPLDEGFSREFRECSRVETVSERCREKRRRRFEGFWIGIIL